MKTGTNSWQKLHVIDLKANKKHALNGGPFGSNLVTKDYVDDGVPVIRGCNLPMDARFSLEDLVFVSEEKADELLPNNAHPGDLVFTQRGTLGQVGLIPLTSKYKRFVISQSQMKLTIDEDKADRLFLYYYFRTPETVQRIHNVSFSSGVPHINLETLRAFEVTLPPLSVQCKIASILSAYDDLIENNTRRIKILEEMAQTIYREWFVEFRAPNVELRKATPEEKKLTGKNVFPKGWEIVRLGEVAEEKRRGVNPSAIGQDTPYFGLEHLPRNSIALSDWGFAREVKSTKLAFQKREILFGKIRPYFHKVGVAPLDGVCSSDTIVIVPKQKIFFGIVLGCVSSEEFVKHATQTSQGTKMPRANWDVLVKYPVVKPGQETLTNFDRLVGNIVDLIINTIFRNRNLRRTRDLLLPKLMSGEIQIENVEVRMSNDK
jgi:type I restriction enzyme S subunit